MLPLYTLIHTCLYNLYSLLHSFDRLWPCRLRERLLIPQRSFIPFLFITSGFHIWLAARLHAASLTPWLTLTGSALVLCHHALFIQS